MIPAIHRRGSDTSGLITYLTGPGRAEAHTDPHVVAAWTGAPALTELTRLGLTDPSALARFLEAPALLAGRDPARHVWHCSVRLHPTDPVLDDPVWAQIARTFLDAVGLAPAGDPAAARWLAVRHAEDHIHLVATLYRLDGRRLKPDHDRTRAQACARSLEEHLGLYQLGPRDRTAAVAPGRDEAAKARRIGLPRPAREDLRARVRFAAATATTPEDFLDRLRAADLLVRTRTRAGTIVGYTVALPADRAASGEPVQYAGGRLAADLTWPRICQRLAAPAPIPDGPLTAVINESLHAAAESDPDKDPGLAAAVADLLHVAAARARPGARADFTAAAETFDHAARQPAGAIAPPGPAAIRLRGAARRLAETVAGPATWALAARIAEFIVSLAKDLSRLRHRQDRPAQTRAADRTVDLLSAHAALDRRPARPDQTGRTHPRRHGRPANTGDHHGRTTHRFRR